MLVKYFAFQGGERDESLCKQTDLPEHRSEESSLHEALRKGHSLANQLQLLLAHLEVSVGCER